MHSMALCAQHGQRSTHSTTLPPRVARMRLAAALLNPYQAWLREKERAKEKEREKVSFFGIFLWRPRQVGRWSDEEVDALTDLIIKYGESVLYQAKVW